MVNSQLFKIIIERLKGNVAVMFQSLVAALPLGILTGVICWWVIKTYQRRKNINIEKRKCTAFILFLSYMVVVFELSILFRQFGTIREIDLVPFNAEGGIRYIILYVVANIIIFLPVGILIPMIWKRFNDVKKVLFFGFLVSLFIESCQLLLQCGIFQTEDLISNTIGAGIGYYMYKRYLWR